MRPTEAARTRRAGGTTAGRRRLVVNADDFGRSASVNAAILRAHREGILTTASLMVNEAGFEEAVGLAHANPGLGVGLHLTLVCGHSALPHREIPGLVNRQREFSGHAARSGSRFFFSRGLREELRKEVFAQFARFRATGLPLDHVNGHLHLHLHPTIFRILIENAEALGIQRLRLTRDPLRLNLTLARGQLVYRLSHALIFGALAARAQPVLKRKGVRHTRYVFGLLQNGRVDEDYVTSLLAALPAGDSELYSHPSVDEFEHELRALISPRVRETAAELGIECIRYQDL